MQPALGREKEAAELSKARSPLTGEVEKILKEAKEGIKIEARGAVFDEGKKLTGEDLKTPTDPEEFTKQKIIEKVFSLLEITTARERKFDTPEGKRKVDYGVEEKRFLLEAKSINADLREKSQDGAVNQIKGIFKLAEAQKNYDFGIATDGLKWIFIYLDGKEIAECHLVRDFPVIEAYITGKRPAAQKREAEISKRFYEWYNALLHGGTYHDLEKRRRSISEADCLVANILNTKVEEEREEIAQVLVDRLIFIKFLQARRLIEEDVLEYLSTLGEDILNAKLRQLFFAVLNTEADKRINIDPRFKDIPYLNGSLFTLIKAEERNPEYQVKADILKGVIRFLDTFRFASEGTEEEWALNPEILGYIFERAMTATDRKGTGAYYTPKTITQYICENTIHPYILERARTYLKERKGYKEEELPKSFDDLLKLRDLTLSDLYGDVILKTTVLDPACGSGAFLYQAANILLDICKLVEEGLSEKRRNSEIALKKTILKDCIYGVDINPKAVEIAKLRLWLWMAESYDPEEHEPAALPNIEYNICAGNSLVGYTDISELKEVRISLDDYLGHEMPLDELLKKRDVLLFSYKDAKGERAKELRAELEALDAKTKRTMDIRFFQELLAKKIEIKAEELTNLKPFHWGFDFHKVFEDDGKGFSVVIGNPPYVRQEALKEQKQIYKEYYETYHGVADLYIYFYERGHKLLRPGGRFGFISSNKFMRANYGQGLRKFLTNEISLCQIIDFNELPVFEGVAIMPAVIITKDVPSPEQKFLFVKMESLEFNSLEAEVKRLATSLDDCAIAGYNWSLGGKKEIEIMRKMERLGQPLGGYVSGKINYGIKTGFNEAFIIDRETKDILIKRDPKSAEIIKPLIVGDDIRKYEINFRDRYLIWTYIGVDIERYPAIKKHLEQFQSQLEKRWDKGNYWWELRACDYYAAFEKPKIIYPVIAKEQRFAFDTDGCYSNDKTFIIPSNDLYLLSILNSLLVFKYAQRTLSGLLGGEFEFRAAHISSFPIRRISFSTPEPERQRRVEEMKALYSKGDLDQVLNLVEGCLPRDEQGNFIPEKEKSDVVHDLLAFLAERMIEMNKEKQGEIKSFLERLEGLLGVKIDDLTGKAALREYYAKDWNELRTALEKNKSKVKKLGEAGTLEAVKREFEGSKEKLSPLLERIENTDRLIDQVVYRLYGLTEEEIGIVESHN